MATKFNCNDKIFIDRSESQFKHCQFQNNKEIITFLNSKGFTSYKIGQLDFFEQIYLFNNAKIIIGPHGAAFSNIIFCKPKTKIIELKSVNAAHAIENLAKKNDLNYISIEAKVKKIYEFEFPNQQGSIQIPISSLIEAIEK